MGELRSEFLESDDLKIRGESLRGALNTQIKTTRTVAARMGSVFIKTTTDARDIYEIRTDDDNVFALVIHDDSLRVIDEDGVILHVNVVVPWVPGGRVWVEAYRGVTLLGGLNGISTLTYSAGSWALTDFSFDFTSGGALAQPYWVYTKGLTMTPSATTGAVTLTSSGAFWTAAYVGQRVRYNRREILITGYTSPTVVSGTVVSSLPPSYRLTATSMASFQVGDAVVSANVGYTGIVVAVTATTIDVATLEVLDGPDVGELISCPSGSATITVKALISPLASPIWDEPLMSPIRGYPRAAASAAGRLCLIDFPGAPDVIALSSARSITDFEVGIDDDDAIVRAVGDNAPRFHRVVNAGDLVFLTDKGLYYVSLRDGSLLTPASFNPVLFDKRACAITRPVQIGTSVIFVEASKEVISMATLDGNIYLKWSVRTLSTLHKHLINNPTRLCSPSIYATGIDKYLFVINEDGTMAVMSFSEDFAPENIGFVPWATQGAYRSVSPVFGRYWAIVDRTLGGVLVSTIEKFRPSALLDCEMPYDSAVPFANMAVSLHGGGFYGGMRTVDALGVVPDIADMPAGSKVGLPFTTSVYVWPVKHVDSPFAGIKRARPVRGSVAIRSTGAFKVRANNSTRDVGGYSAGDDVALPPPLKTRVVKFGIWGNRDYPEIEIIKDEPGEFEVMAVTQEVTL
jgi:hypothetical protein